MKTLLERIADMASCVGGNVGEVLLDAAKEIDALLAKIERMEKQEPVAWVNTANLASAEVERGRGGQGDTHTWAERPTAYHTKALYARPIPPAPSVLDGWQLVPIKPTEEMINKVIDERIAALMSGKDHSMLDIYHAMLAAAPEAKP